MRYLLLFILCLSFPLSWGQRVTYNQLPESYDINIAALKELFEGYIRSKTTHLVPNPYWNQADQAKWLDYDFLEKEFQPSLFMGFPVHVLSIAQKEGYYQIKAQFSYCQEDGSPYVLAIVNYIAKEVSGAFLLYNALDYNSKAWKHHKVDWIDFYHPSYHTFDMEKARSLSTFIERICLDFKVSPRPMHYYFADTYDEVQALRGLDYYLGMGGSLKPSGKAGESKVYCAGLGEYYPHEVFHVQIDPHFPNKHFWVSEGIATLLGGSRGKSLTWHIKRCHAYLEMHPELDLSLLLELRNMDEETAFHYVLGGLIAKRIFEKGGYPLLIEFMNSGKSDQDYYTALEQFLGVKRGALNEYLRTQISIEANLVESN